MRQRPSFSSLSIFGFISFGGKQLPKLKFSNCSFEYVSPQIALNSMQAICQVHVHCLLSQINWLKNRESLVTEIYCHDLVTVDMFA